MKKRQQNETRLQYWQDRIEKNKTAWEQVRTRMDEREGLYNGTRKLRQMVKCDKKTETPHVYNIVAENVESIVDSTIPMPKVTPMREKDQKLARIIEHMIANEMDRLPMEEVNDMMERTVPIQGGALLCVEWDHTKKAGNRIGAVTVSYLHPKMLIPQDGVYTGIEDMDYVAVIRPQTKESIKRRYGVDLDKEAESDPEIKGAKAESRDSAEDMVTQYVVYYRKGDAIGRYSWVNHVELEDIEDFQARHLRRCKKCGAVENTGNLIMKRPTEDSTYPDGAETGEKAQKGECPYCHGREWEDSVEEYEELLSPVEIGGERIGGTVAAVDELGNEVLMATARVPYYKPDCYPLILQKNVSVFGQLLGDSDVDKIADQQNTINRLSAKIIDRLMKAGSRVSLPPSTKITTNPEDGETWRLESIQDKQYIGVYDFTGNLQYEMAYLAQVYQESRNILGITDSYQGRTDSTATSGKAKQFAAAQSAGRMESKRVMKRYAYSRLFEMIFKLMLANCDEPQPVIHKDKNGAPVYEKFNRYDFLERGEDGQWRWNTNFLFSVDDSGGLAQNRSQMWQELTSQLQAGALGNPTDLDTLIVYWRAMEEEHYPGAGKRVEDLAERKKAQIQAKMQAAAATVPAAQPTESGMVTP